MSQPHVTLVRAVNFSSGHRYYNPEFSPEENKQLYGSYYKESGLGHNFKLEAFYRGPVDPHTGMVLSLVDVDAWLRDLALALDHHYLNEDIPFFKDNVPTAENIARYCYDQLVGKVPLGAVELLKVRLYEGENLWVDYPA